MPKVNRDIMTLQLKRINTGINGENYQYLLYVRRRYIHSYQLRSAIASVINAIFEIRSPHIWGEGTPILTRPINWELIRQQYDQMVKYATALRLGTAPTEAITNSSLIYPEAFKLVQFQGTFCAMERKKERRRLGRELSGSSRLSRLCWRK